MWIDRCNLNLAAPTLVPSGTFAINACYLPFSLLRFIYIYVLTILLKPGSFYIGATSAPCTAAFSPAGNCTYPAAIASLYFP